MSSYKKALAHAEAQCAEIEMNCLCESCAAAELPLLIFSNALLIKPIRAESISAVFIENVADPRLVQQIANETGSVVGGRLFPGALSDQNGPAATYLELMRHNATTIATALTAAKSL